MTFQEFIKKYDGRGIDFDGAFGDQCMDLYRQYVQEVLELPQSPAVAGAKDVWDTYLKDKYDRINYAPGIVPKSGDIVIWGKELGNTFGHIAVFISGDQQSFKSFDQNWPVGTKCHTQTHNYNAVLGWIRKRGIIGDMTCQEELAQEKKDHAESIKEKKLNYDKWQTQLSRANGLDEKLAQETANHKETLEKLIATQAEVEKLGDKIRKAREDLA